MIPAVTWLKSITHLVFFFFCGAKVVDLQAAAAPPLPLIPGVCSQRSLQQLSACKSAHGLDPRWRAIVVAIRGNVATGQFLFRVDVFVVFEVRLLSLPHV